MNSEEKIDQPSLSLGVVLSKSFSCLKKNPLLFFGPALFITLPYILVSKFGFHFINKALPD